MSKPLFSIIIPVYNVENFIQRTLQSCINQNFRNIEIILIDDCGSDNSISIAKEIAKKDFRIRIIYNEKNQGPFLSRINGAINANSNYLLFLDSDDTLDIRACEIAFGEIGDDTKLICYDILKEKENGEFQKDNIFSDANFHSMLEFAKFICECKKGYWRLAGKIIQKELFIKATTLANIKQNVIMAEDALMFYFILKALCDENIGGGLAMRDKAIYLYHHNPKSTTRNTSKANLLAIKKGHRYVLDKIGKDDIFAQILYDDLYDAHITYLYLICRKSPILKFFRRFLGLYIRIIRKYMRFKRKRLYKRLVQKLSQV